MYLFLIFNIEHFRQFSNPSRIFFRKIFPYTNIIYLYKSSIMKKLDTNQLFNIFEIGDEEVYREHQVHDILDNPFTLMGTVVSGVENYYILDQLYIKKYKEVYDSVRKSLKLKYFTGLMKYLERIKEIPEDMVYDIEREFGIQSIDYALQEMLDLFEQEEYYEKCIVLVKFREVFSLKQLVE